MARKSNHISILQFDAQAISRLRVRRSAKGIEVLGFDHEAGPWGAEAHGLEHALTQFVQQHNLHEDTVYTVLPRHDIATRILTLPTQNPSEAANMVQLSAEEFVPYTIEEMIIDQCILTNRPNGEAQVLAALAHRDVVNGHLGLLQKAGIAPDGVFLSTACLATLLQLCAQNKNLPHARRLALVHLGSGGIEVIVAGQGDLLFSRGIATVQDWSTVSSLGGAPGKSAEEVSGTSFSSLVFDEPTPSATGALQELTAEIRGSLSAFRRESEDGESVEGVYLCSETPTADEMASLISEEIHLPCHMADFARALVTYGAEHLAAMPLVMLGAALMAQERGEIRVNLLPAAAAEVKHLENAQRMVVRFGLVAAAILVALLGLYFQSVHQRQVYINELESKVAAIEPNARGVASMREQLQILSRQVERNGSALELLATVCEAVPGDAANITAFTYRRTEGINIYGRAKSVDDIHAFTKTLRGMAKSYLKMFAQAKSLYEQQGKERDQEVFDYQVVIPFTEEEQSDTAPTSRK